MSITLNTIVSFDTDTVTPLPYRWRSKQFDVAYPTVFRVARVTSDSYANTTLNLFADGVQYASIPVYSQEEFGIPQAMSYRYFFYEIVGTDAVRRVQIAEDFEELT